MTEEDIPDMVATLRDCAEDSRKVEGDYYADQFSTDASVFDDAADMIESLRDEITRLRESIKWHKEVLVEAEEVMCRKNLTDAEREAIRWAIEVSDSLADCGATGTGGNESRESATLRGLLKRLG